MPRGGYTAQGSPGAEEWAGTVGETPGRGPESGSSSRDERNEYAAADKEEGSNTGVAHSHLPSRCIWELHGKGTAGVPLPEGHYFY